jgi:hypothetical protein
MKIAAKGGGGGPPRGEGATRAEGPLPRYCHEPCHKFMQPKVE